MRFITFQAIAFHKKPEVSVEKQKLYKDLLDIECKQGISWAVPLCKDPLESITRMALTQPNFPNLLILFETDAYCVVDKVKWEACVQKGLSKSELPNCILPKDSEDKPYYEYIVPHQELTLKTKSVFLSQNARCIEPENATQFNEEYSSEYSSYIQKFLKTAPQLMSFGGDFDSYEKMYWFYSFLKEENYPYIQIYDHRKAPCPCGSGKKFKNCHGKDLI